MQASVYCVSLSKQELWHMHVIQTKSRGAALPEI